MVREIVNCTASVSMPPLTKVASRSVKMVGRDIRSSSDDAPANRLKCSQRLGEFVDALKQCQPLPTLPRTFPQIIGCRCLCSPWIRPAGTPVGPPESLGDAATKGLRTDL